MVVDEPRETIYTNRLRPGAVRPRIRLNIKNELFLRGAWWITSEAKR